MGICDISQTYERAQYIDYTQYIYMNSLSFISQSPGMSGKNWIIANAFPASIWICIFVSFLFLSFILVIFSNNRLQEYGSFVLTLYRVLVQQCKCVD